MPSRPWACVGDNPGSPGGGDAAAPDAGIGVDAGPPCDLQQAFGAPVLLTGTGINTFSGGDGGASLGIYQTQRASLSAPFDMPVAQDALNVQQYQGEPSLSADGLTIFFNAYSGIANDNIHSATRGAIATPGERRAPSPTSTSRGRTTKRPSSPPIRRS